MSDAIQQTGSVLLVWLALLALALVYDLVVTRVVAAIRKGIEEKIVEIVRRDIVRGGRLFDVIRRASRSE